MRPLNTELASVSDQLSGERDDLGAALQNLAVALGEVSTFVHDNRTVLTTDVSQLADVTTAVAKQKDALAETLRNAPVALSEPRPRVRPGVGHARQPGRPARRRGRQPAALRAWSATARARPPAARPARCCGSLGDRLGALGDTQTGDLPLGLLGSGS